jgi:uncharacterized protein YgiM (DUF1202 family)
MTQETQKMTAVEWLALRYHHRQGYLSQDDIAEAKAMEKEQIIQSSRISYLAGQEYYTLNGLSKQFAEEYYNKTYKK